MLNIKNQPRSLWILAFSNLWDTFSYYGTQTILALYLIHIFKLSINESYLIYGAYAALVYSTPILGGFIADKWLGSHKALIIGSSLSILGNLLLIVLARYWFSLGLAITLIGTGLYKSTTANLVGALYSKTCSKETGYTWLYLSSNVGGALAPIIYGLIAYNFGWNYSFLCSTAGIFISLTWFLFNRKAITEVKPYHKPNMINSFTVYIGISLACIFLSLPFYYPFIISPLVIFLMAIGIIYLISLACTYKDTQRKRIIALLALNFFGMFYLVAGMQIGITIVTFIQEKIHQGVIKIHLPASIFGTFYALFVLLLAPLIGWLWTMLRSKGIPVSSPSKLALGLFLSAGGIFVFSFATTTTWVISSIILSLLLLSAGELVLSPSMYTVISNNAPAEIKSIMIGGWFLFMALGGYLSAVMAKLANVFAENLAQSNYPEYFWQFIFIGSCIALIGTCLLLFIPKLNKILS